MEKGYTRADSCSADRDLSWLRSGELNTTPNYETRQKLHTFCNIHFNFILLTTWQLPGCLSLSLSLSLALVISSSCFPVRNIALKFSLLANMTGFYVFMRIQLLLRSGVHLCCSQPILNVRVATLKMSLYLCKVISWWFVTLTWTASYRLWCDRLRGMCWYPHFMMSFHLVEDLHSQF